MAEVCGKSSEASVDSSSVIHRYAGALESTMANREASSVPTSNLASKLRITTKAALLPNGQKRTGAGNVTGSRPPGDAASSVSA